MICNLVYMPQPNHNPNRIDGEVLKTVELLKYLGQQYLLGVILIWYAALDIMGD